MSAGGVSLVPYRKSKYDACANSHSYILQSNLSSAMAAFHHLFFSFKVRVLKGLKMISLIHLGCICRNK